MILYGIISIVMGYLLGSIPTAVWLGRIKYGIDIRDHGSKNGGATNTFRVLGKKPGIVVLAIDISKGICAACFPMLFTQYFSPESLENFKMFSGIAAVIGHVYPIFAGFNGGKGVATSLGIVIGIHPAAALICIAVFLLVFISTQYVSLGAIVASFVFPFAVNFLFEPPYKFLSIFSVLLSLAVIGLHEKNIRRLIKGEEGKMNLFKK